MKKLQYTRNHFILVITLAFLIVFNINFLTPMHSDDYSYYNLGLSWSAHIKHYFTWSGRFIIDYISSLLLIINNDVIISSINSFVLVFLIYTLTTIPYFCSYYNYSKITLSFVLLFCTYWISIPDLGQTAFWIVGSVNYMWPCLFAAIFIKYFLKLYFNHNSLKYKIISVIFAFLSGLSNEIMALTIVCFISLFTLKAFYQKNPLKYFVVICFFIILIGASVEIFAPGNFSRIDVLKSKGLDWFSLTISQKLKVHFLERIPNNLLIASSPLYISFVLLILPVKKQLKNIKDNNIFLLFLFCLLSFLTIFILLGSPQVLSRAGTVTTFFSCLAFSFLVYENQLVKPNHRLFTLNYKVIILCFLFSYCSQYRAFYNYYIQDSIRKQIIYKNISRGNKIFDIPDYFHLPLAKETYDIDYYHNKDAMGSYYGVKKIERTMVHFNYAVINQSCNAAFSAKYYPIKCLWTYSFNPLDRNKCTFVIELQEAFWHKLDSDPIIYAQNTTENNAKIEQLPSNVQLIDDRLFLSFSDEISAKDIKLSLTRGGTTKLFDLSPMIDEVLDAKK